VRNLRVLRPIPDPPVSFSLSDHAPTGSARADIARLASACVLPASQERYNPPKLFDQAQDPGAKVRPDFGVR